jgi:signal peptidase I
MGESDSRSHGGPDPAAAYVPQHAKPPPAPPPEAEEPPGGPADEASGYVPQHARPGDTPPPTPDEPAQAAPAAEQPPAPVEPPAAEGEGEPGAEDAEEPKKPAKAGINPFIELILILAVAFGLAYVVQGWVVKPYRIPSVSMEPTLKVGDMVLVNRFIYRIHPPRRGDVVVFHPPGVGQTPIRGARTEASVNFIKRVIGLPGETIQIVHGTTLICRAPHRSCFALHEPYVMAHHYPSDNYGPYTIPKGDYFVMGDNRGNSDDSRVWGPLPRRNIIGEAFMIYWPLNRIGTL